MRKPLIILISIIFLVIITTPVLALNIEQTQEDIESSRKGTFKNYSLTCNSGRKFRIFWPKRHGDAKCYFYSYQTNSQTQLGKPYTDYFSCAEYICENEK